MKKIKKFLAVALTLAMVMGMMSISAMAADAPEYTDVNNWYISGSFNDWALDRMDYTATDYYFEFEIELEAGKNYEYGIAANENDTGLWVCGEDKNNFSYTPATTGVYLFTFKATWLYDAEVEPYDDGTGYNYYVLDDALTVEYVHPNYTEADTWEITGSLLDSNGERVAYLDEAMTVEKGLYSVEIELDADITVDYVCIGLIDDNENWRFTAHDHASSRFSYTTEEAGIYKFTFDPSALADAPHKDDGLYSIYRLDDAVTITYLGTEEETTTKGDDNNPTTTAASEDTGDSGTGDHTVVVLLGAFAALAVAIVATKKFAVEK